MSDTGYSALYQCASAFKEKIKYEIENVKAPYPLGRKFQTRQFRIQVWSLLAVSGRGNFCHTSNGGWKNIHVKKGS